MDNEDLPGSMGTRGGFWLRVGQILFSSSALLIMSLVVQFYQYTAFCYLVTVMGLMIPWSFALAIMDFRAISMELILRDRTFMVTVVVGDWVLSLLSLAAACASAGVVDLLLVNGGPFCPPKHCGRYQLSIAMAFFSWFMIASSSLANLWELFHWLS